MRGKDLAVVIQTSEVSEATYRRWLALYRGMKREEAKQLRGLTALSPGVLVHLPNGCAGSRGRWRVFHLRSAPIRPHMVEQNALIPSYGALPPNSQQNWLSRLGSFGARLQVE